MGHEHWVHIALYCLDPLQLHIALINNKVIYCLNVGKSIFCVVTQHILDESASLCKIKTLELLKVKMFQRACHSAATYTDAASVMSTAHNGTLRSHWGAESNRQVSGGHTPARDASSMGKGFQHYRVLLLAWASLPLVSSRTQRKVDILHKPIFTFFKSTVCKRSCAPFFKQYIY